MAPDISSESSKDYGNSSENEQPEVREYGLGSYPGPAVMTWNNKLTALVVDYKDFVRKLERDYLTYYGVETQTADSGPTALDIIFWGADFSLIVIEIDMLGMTGIECTRRLRTMGVGSLILGTTAVFDNEDECEFLEAGGDVLIEKPFVPSKFVPILQQLDNQG